MLPIVDEEGLANTVRLLLAKDVDLVVTAEKTQYLVQKFVDWGWLEEIYALEREDEVTTIPDLSSAPSSDPAFAGWRLR